MHSAWFKRIFVGRLKFLQTKEGGENFRGEPILKKVWVIWSPFLSFNFESFTDPNSLAFIIFQFIRHDYGVLFSEFWNFSKLKRGDLISGENQFCRMSELLRPAFCTLILKVLWTQIFRYSLYFNAFCLIQQYFFRSFGVYRN